MKNITLLLALLLSTVSFAQQSGDVVIFDNSGYRFHVILNGVMQNQKAESNVRIQGLQASYYSATIMADDNSFSLDKNIIVKRDTLITYRIINKKGKRKLRFFSEVPMNTAPAPAANQTLISFHTGDIPMDTEEDFSSSTTTQTTTTTTVSTTEQSQTLSGGSIDVDMSVSGTDGMHSETVSTETTITESSEGVATEMNVGAGEEHLSISMDVNENGASINIEGIENESATYTGQTTTTTTTTTTTSSGNWTADETEEATMDLDTDYSDCFITEDEFDMFLRLAKNETFEDDRTRMTKEFVEKKCLSVDQIGSILDAFDFSDNRLLIAKSAYGLCYETSEYDSLIDKFDFSDDQDELRNFILNQ